jgi:hypothetical protein
MTYNDLLQLYFERSNALQAYWTLYVVIVGGVLAFSSLRREPAALTTLVVSILFVLFAYENLDAILETSRQRFAMLDALKASPIDTQQVRASIEPTLRPATLGSSSMTHVISDMLTVAGLWVMELRRRKHSNTSADVSEKD